MSLTNYISRKEQNVLLTVTMLWIAIVTLYFCSEFVVSYNESVAAQQKELAILAGAKPGPIFATHSVPKQMLMIHLTSILILVTSLKPIPKRFLLFFLVTAFYFSALVYLVVSCFNTYFNGYFADENYSAGVSIIDRFYLSGNELDILAVFFIPILLFWQISILLRMLIKNTQRKNVLP